MQEIKEIIERVKVYKQQFPILLIGFVISIIAILIGGWLILGNGKTTMLASEIVQSTETMKSSHKKLIIDIKGEVQKPGVYEINEGMRLHEAIQLAGGLSEQADATQINLAQQLDDEMVIIIPSKTQNTNGGEVQPSTKLNLNTATKEELMGLDGIGVKKAEAIIAYRQSNGRLKKIEDLKAIKGFSDKLIQSLKMIVRVS